MRNIILFSLLFISFAAQSIDKQSVIAFNVSMDNPNTHYYHVNLTYEGNTAPSVDFKLPSWTPGYYIILDYAKNIINFSATDETGNALQWKKTTKNTWQVIRGDSKAIKVSYDVYAFRVSVGDPFLDYGRAFIAPAGVFMYVDGKLDLSCTVTIDPFKNFSTVSTGLDKVEGKTNTFFAADFDILYDSPILAGNQEILTFEVSGIVHTMAIENPGDFDRKKIISDHKKMVESAVAVIGEIPYKHYTFLIMNRGMGGLEHLNSMAVFTNTSAFGKEEGYKRWMSFVTHEFFHLYNVKRIRPIALGPFDYDRENYTNMLWVSEGITVYYEYLILNRAGFLTRNEVLEELRSVIRSYENVPGHLFQSATESSFDTWIHFFNRSENALNTTISYYDKGCALGLLLDLKIRSESKNQKSLDDVMRYLYKVYYKQMNRGFTDNEFRQVCEKMAGCSLSEIFDVYARTTRDIDYNKYLRIAGLTIDTGYVEVQGTYTGVTVREDGDNLMIIRTEYNSPGFKAGLSVQDNVKEINGVKATLKLWDETINRGKPGEKVSVLVARRELSNMIDITPDIKRNRSFNIGPMDTVIPEQNAILVSWLK